MSTNRPDPQWISEFLASRRSTRDFLSTPVSDEILDQILTDSLTAPSWSNTRPFKVAIATGEVRDRISGEFLSRWHVLSRIMRKGIRNKLRLIYSRYGLPTSNRSIVKPYVAELRPRAQRVGKELYELFGVKRGIERPEMHSGVRIIHSLAHLLNYLSIFTRVYTSMPHLMLV